MSGRHSFRELTEGFSPERRQRIKVIKEELLAEAPPNELRQASSHTWQDLDKLLNLNQPSDC